MAEPSFLSSRDMRRWDRFRRRWLELDAQMAEHLAAGGTGFPQGWTSPAQRLHSLGALQYMTELDRARREMSTDQRRDHERHHKLAALKKVDPQRYREIKKRFPIEVERYERCWCIDVL